MKSDPLFKPMNPKQFRFSLWYFLVTLIGLFVINTVFLRPKIESIDYSDFKAKINSGEILRIEIGDKYLTGFSMTRAQLEAYKQTRLGDQKPATAPRTFRTVRTTDPDLIPLMDKKSLEYYAVAPANELLAGRPPVLGRCRSS